MAKTTKQASSGKQGGNNKQKTATQGANQKGTAMAGASGNATSIGTSAIAALKQDHRRVEGLFSQFESATDEHRKQDLIAQICNELNIHTRLEEEIFYPACREAIDDEDIMDEAQVEHDAAKLLIADLVANMGEDDPYCDAKVKLLSEQIKHHVAEEEKPGEGIFAKAQEHDVDSAELATELAERKQELQSRGPRLRPTRAVSFDLDVGELMEGPMRSGGEGRGMRGGRRYYEEDDRGRGQGRSEGRGGWFGDSEGHSRAARERWEDDDRRSRSRGRYEDDDNDRGGRGRGQGGWFGDSEGHSRAAREGWDEGHRGSSRSRSRYEDDDDDRRGRGRGGWFGDPEGHSRAAREGRDEDRGGSYRSRSRRDDDDDGRGWHGDPRGHAEAARRGWSHRR